MPKKGKYFGVANDFEVAGRIRDVLEILYVEYPP